MTAVLFTPAIAGVILALVLILRDANPFARPETPMLEQLAAMGLADLPSDPIYNPDDFDPPDWQDAWEATLDQQYSGADEDGDCVQCGLNKAVCLCESVDLMGVRP